MPTPVSLGRKPAKDVGCHQDLIQDVLTEFFAIGQKLTLKAFCYSVEEYKVVYQSVRRHIANNTILKSVQTAQCKTEGFNERLSDMAIREVLGEVECISQEFCCGLDNETVKEYCELVPNQTRYEVSKGSCRAKTCAMSVPPIASTARTLGWVNTRNGKVWRCSHCTKANEYANTTEEQLKNDIST